LLSGQGYRLLQEMVKINTEQWWNYDYQGKNKKLGEKHA
jgi:hypothetical protein